MFFVWLAGDFTSNRQCNRMKRRALDGLRQEKFNLNLPTGSGFYPQTNKGNLAVNGATLAQCGRAVKFEFVTFRCVHRCVGA
jgi:hypothetical protein